MCRSPGCADAVPASTSLAATPTVASAGRRKDREQQASLERLYGRFLARLPANVLAHEPPPRTRPVPHYMQRYAFGPLQFRGRPGIRKWAARLIARLRGRSSPSGDCGCFMALLRLRRWCKSVPTRLRRYFSVRPIDGPPPEHLKDLLLVATSPTASALMRAAGTDVSVWALGEIRFG